MAKSFLSLFIDDKNYIDYVGETKSNELSQQDNGRRKSQKPSPDSIDYGELAVGYHVLNERLFFKNDDDEIVEIPVQNIVKFRDWQINEEDGSYYWTAEREFHNLDDIYDYIRLCQNKTDMYDQRKGTLGCAQCEDGNTYFFVSPKADYSSLLDPGRLTGNGEMVHSKTKYSPFGEKCIVRKHIP